MTDEDAERLVPVVEEFVREVGARDEAAVWACFEHSDARTLAVLCADLLLGARARVRELERVEFAYVRTRRDLVEERSRVRELREILGARAAAADPGRGKAYA